LGYFHDTIQNFCNIKIHFGIDDRSIPRNFIMWILVSKAVPSIKLPYDHEIVNFSKIGSQRSQRSEMLQTLCLVADAVNRVGSFLNIDT
jgi:hypothetical protein